MLHSDNSEAKATLRPLDGGDRVALVDLWVDAWRETMPAIDFEARRDWIGAFLDDPRHATLVARVDGRPAGFVSTEGDYLHQLVVAPDVRGTGIAAVLLAAVATGRVLRLDVNQANRRAIRFYEKHGFVVTSAGSSAASGLATWTMRRPAPSSQREGP